MLLSEFAINMSLSCIFSHDIKMFFVCKKSIEIDDILMFEFVVDSELLRDLVLYLFLSNYWFFYDFESA